MGDSGLVGGEQGLADLGGPGQGVREGERAGGEVAQGRAVYAVPGVDEGAPAADVGGAVVVNGDNVRVGKALGDADFPAEGGLAYGTALIQFDDLECDPVAFLEVVGAPYLAHASAADRVHQPVTVGHRCAAHRSSRSSFSAPRLAARVHRRPWRRAGGAEHT